MAEALKIADDEGNAEFEINDSDLYYALNPHKRKRMSKEQQIYGVWADKEEEVEERPTFGSSKNSFMNFVSGGTQAPGQSKMEETGPKNTKNGGFAGLRNSDDRSFGDWVKGSKGAVLMNMMKKMGYEKGKGFALWKVEEIWRETEGVIQNRRRSARVRWGMGFGLSGAGATKIIDMTGPVQKVYNDYNAFSTRTKSAGVARSGFDVPELTHNLNLLLEMEENDIRRNYRLAQNLKNMADPLRLLCEHTKGKRPLRELDCDGEVYYVFGDVAYPRDVKTSLQVYNKAGEFYSLQSLLTLWEKRHAQHTVYVRDVTASNIQVVTRPDRKEIIDYLEGHRAEPPSSYSVYATAPPPTPLARLNEQRQHHNDSIDQPAAKKARLDNDARGNRLVGRLLDDTVGQSADGEMRSLSNELTVERIAELKNKVKKQKRHQIKTVDTIDGDFDATDSGAGLGLRDEGVRARTWRNRNTCLVAPNRNFSSVLSVLQSLQLREEAIAKQKNGQSTSSAPTKPRAPQQTGYSRYEQEQYEEDETSGYQINTSLTFHGSSFNAIKSAPNAKPIATPSASKPPPPRAADTSNGKPAKRPSRTPIIVIPASTSSLITMYNVRDILQEMKYIKNEERKNQRREAEVLIQRRKDGGITVPYRVIDNPMKLSNDEWDRVVAVFVQGPAWQFKGWRWNGNPTDIFSHVAAFHLKYDGEKMDANVSKWSVNIISLSKTKRHLDRANLGRFWQVLERHIQKHKPHLRY